MKPVNCPVCNKRPYTRIYYEAPFLKIERWTVECINDCTTLDPIPTEFHSESISKEMAIKIWNSATEKFKNER